MVGLFLFCSESFLGPFIYVNDLKLRLCNQFKRLKKEQLLGKRVPLLSGTIGVVRKNYKVIVTILEMFVRDLDL